MSEIATQEADCTVGHAGDNIIIILYIMTCVCWGDYILQIYIQCRVED